MRHRALCLIYANPAAYPPLERMAFFLANHGWQVRIAGVRIHGDAGVFRPIQHPQLSVGLLPDVKSRFLRKLHYLVWMTWSVLRLFPRPHLIHISDANACIAGLLAAILARVPIVYQEHDVSTATAGLVGSIRGAARKAVIRRALCVVPNERRGALLRSAAPPRRLAIVPNAPLRDDVRHRSHRPSGLRLAWHGSIVPARLPLTLIYALAHLPEDVRLSVAGYETIGAPSYSKTVLRLADELRIRHRINWVGPVSTRAELLDLCAECDVGVTLLVPDGSDPNLDSMAEASNKPYDYLACGLALLVPDLPDYTHLYVRSGYGLACDPSSVGSISGAIMWFREHPTETRSMGERGQARIVADWNFESLFEPVFSTIEEWAERESQNP